MIIKDRVCPCCRVQTIRGERLKLKLKLKMKLKLTMELHGFPLNPVTDLLVRPVGFKVKSHSKKKKSNL